MDNLRKKVLNTSILENCRLCQKAIGTIPLDTCILRKILNITKIKTDNEWQKFLPKCICKLCQKILDDTDNFVLMVQQVDTRLSRLVKTSGFSSNNSIVNKYNNSLTVDKFKCPICNKHFKCHSSFIIHKKTHPELICTGCDTVFETTLGNTHQGCTEKDITNNSSLATINSPVNLIAETETKKLPCKNSEKTINNKDRFGLRLATHKEFTCSNNGCSKVFKARYLLNKHKLVHEGKRQFLCVTCGKRFPTKNSLSCHEKIHLEVKSYQCDICNIGFSVRSNLRAHLRIHHEGMRFYCSQCSKEFLTKVSLNRHEKTHSGIREFKCEQCTSSFYTKKELVKHQRYHQGLKRHKCKECFKTFFESHHLIIHLRSHTGEKPFVCDIPQCRKAFIDKQKLKRHEKAKHNEQNVINLSK